MLAQAAPIDPALVVRVTPDPGRTPGVAFAIADAGVWLTARRVVDGCRTVAVLIAPGEGVQAKVHSDPLSDVAVLTAGGGAQSLPLAGTVAPDKELVFAPGFVGGRAGEVATRFLGAELLRRHDRSKPNEEVEVLAEVGRTEGLRGPLPSLTGAPALDGAGRVVGVILGEAPRRGRYYAAPPLAMIQALAAAGVAPSATAAGLAITADNYGLAADELRRELRVAPLVCEAQ